MKKKHIFCLLAILLLGNPTIVTAQNDSKDLSSYILTPPAPDYPRINSAKVFGVRPESPVLYKIAASGAKPIKYSTSKLPSGLKLDSEKGIITGKIKKPGDYNITLKAANAYGTSERTLRLVVGNTIALTPPMGWNSWNCWRDKVSQENVLSSAKAPEKSDVVVIEFCFSIPLICIHIC